MREPDTGFHMTQSQQDITLLIAAAVLAVIFLGFKALWDAWNDQWDDDDLNAYIEELAADLCADRDQHSTVPMLGRFAA